MVKVKICGITNKETLATVVECGADYCGFVFYPKSPRSISLSKSKSIITELDTKNINCVALFVNPSTEDLQKTIDSNCFDTIQLHGTESMKDIMMWRKQWNHISWIKAIGVNDADDVVNLSKWNSKVDYLLLDTKPTVSDTRPGGLAKTWSWNIAKSLDAGLSIPWFLAGGINVNNVVEAITISKAKIIDASSGLESSLGKKDDLLIKNFIKKIKSISVNP